MTKNDSSCIMNTSGRTLKCLIVDDEPLALDVLETFIGRFNQLELIGRALNTAEALKLMQKHKTDLLFIDIQMPQQSGIDFVKNLHQPPGVIFTTAYNQYAVTGFDLNAIDYLLKPIEFDRFSQAIEKVLKFNSIPVNKQSEKSTQPANYADAFIYVKAEKKMLKIYLNKILCIESIGNYIKIKTEDRDLITYNSMQVLEEKLPQSKFLRVHRSFIIAIDKITAFSPTNIEINKLTIPVGRKYRQKVADVLNQINNFLV